jgi:hypothetical protein
MIPQQVPTRPVIFVDIDGVLNGPADYARWSAACRESGLSPGQVIAEVQSGRPEVDQHVQLLFNPGCVAVLNGICAAANADIVVSSSWRLFYADQPKGELLHILRKAGITAPLLGVTPPKHYQRGEAVRAWLHEERPGGSRILILDDEPSSEFRGLGKWHLRTNEQSGLVPSDVARALQIASDIPYFPRP